MSAFLLSGITFAIFNLSENIPDFNDDLLLL